MILFGLIVRLVCWWFDYVVCLVLVCVVLFVSLTIIYGCLVLIWLWILLLNVWLVLLFSDLLFGLVFAMVLLVYLVFWINYYLLVIFDGCAGSWLT